MGSFVLWQRYTGIVYHLWKEFAWSIQKSADAAMAPQRMERDFFRPRTKRAPAFARAPKRGMWVCHCAVYPPSI